MRGLNTELHRPVTVLSKPIDLAARPSGLVEARQSKPDIPSWDKETSLHLLSRYLAARPSGLVEARQSKPNIPLWDKETSLHLFHRYLAARPSGLVEITGFEPETSALRTQRSTN